MNSIRMLKKVWQQPFTVFKKLLDGNVNMPADVTKLT